MINVYKYFKIIKTKFYWNASLNDKDGSEVTLL